MRSCALVICATVFLAGCPKNVEEAPPPVGWHQEDPETWTGECYYPPDFAGIDALTERRMARQTALEAMKSQWTGSRNDGVSFDSRKVDDLETTLLGRPDRIEEVAQQNLEHCKQVMGAGASTGTWETWLGRLPDQLTAGECNTPLEDTYFHYFDINAGWQLEIPVCGGNRVQITASKDRYRISDDGDWMDADGGAAAASADYPCNREGCNAGMLIARFVSEDGVEDIFPVGRQTTWTAPAHGTLSVGVNDTTYYDNTWYQSGSIIDHTSLEIGPG